MKRSTVVLHDRAAWLDARRAGLGASDAAAVLGVSPWKTPLALYAEKAGFVDPSPAETEAMEWGTLLEPIIATKYAHETGRALVDHGRYTLHVHDTVPYLFATLDREILDARPGVLEIKTTGARHGEAWDDEPPLVYQIQLQHALAVTGWSWGSLAVLIGGQRFVWCDMPRHDGFIALLLEREAEFWRRVEHADPPPPGAADVAMLPKLWPRDDGSSVALPPAALEWDARLTEAKAQLGTWATVRDEAEAMLKAAIGDATVGVLPGGAGRYTWKAHARAGYDVPPSTVRVLRRVGAK